MQEMHHTNCTAGDQMDKRSGLWFWLLLIIVIFVIYCLTMQRPYCQTLDEAAIRNVMRQSQSEPNHQQSTNGSGVNQYQTPPLFDADSLSSASRDSALTKPLQSIWNLNDTVQQIPRPASEQLRPFGYTLFQTRGGTASDPYAAVVPDDYTIGTGDHLMVTVWGRVDFELTLTVDRAGRVMIPQVGPVVVSGMTIDAAQAAIHTRLDDIYSEFDLAVTLGRMRTFRVYVLGEVRQPGAYTVSAAATLIDALYNAGGPNERGTLRAIKHTRGQQVTLVDLYDFLLTGQRNSDPRLSAGDIVFVNVAGPRVAVRGRVKRPGIYELTESATLRDALELAGGFEADAFRDRIMIDRLQETDGRQLVDVNVSDDSDDENWSNPVRDGDDISVFSMYEARPNLVWLKGWVKHPGAFERTDGMTVRDLLDGGEQLKPGAYRGRADLVRPVDDGNWSIVAIDLADAVDGFEDADLSLRDGDRLTVYARDDVQPQSTVTIDGEVQKPGSYQLFQAMRVSDLIFRAGSTTRAALLESVEIARGNADGRTDMIRCNMRDAMERGDLSEDVVLQDGDYVFVRTDPTAGRQRLVNIEGEVRYPGRYALLDQDETFYDLLQRAGGLTPHAFPRGTVFTRHEISEEIARQNFKQILLNSQPLQQDSTGRLYREDLVQLNPDAMTRIVLDVPRVLRERGGEANVVMRPGDQVLIPPKPSGIQVLGAVAAPGTIGFAPGWRVNDYLERAGGTTRSSDGDAVRVVRADGQVNEAGKRNLKVELGDAIFVPPKIEKKTDWLRTLTQTMSIVGGVATTVLVVQTLGN